LPEPIVVGLTGFSRVGKNHVADQLARYLQLNHDVTAVQAAFSDPLKAITHKLFPRMSHDKTDMKVREKYQKVGSLLRHYISETVFIQAMQDLIFENEYPYFFIINDVRYMNEIQWILQGNTLNHIIHVTRPGVGPVNNHDSDYSHLQMKLPTGRYYNDRIHHYNNADDSDPTPLFNTITNHIFKDKDK
jgi:hypothetical protein